MAMPARYAVFGQPIAHSLSPRIHAMFAAQFRIALDYRAIGAGRDDFARVLEACARDGGRGANVTLPLKEDAASLCTALSDRARRCGSVNTLVREGDGWHGDSTDGAGLLQDLRSRCAFEPSGRRCLVLGAGGAARAIAFALADAGIAGLAIWNRTHERAVALAARIGRPNVGALATADLARSDAFDFIVHATAAGHDDDAFDLPANLVASGTLCYDLSYGVAARPFLDAATRAGAVRVCDGLGMLVEQAAESFRLWHGREPDTAPVFDALRHEHALSNEGA